MVNRKKITVGERRFLPEGDVIDRVSQLVSAMAKVSGDNPPIALDEVSAGLLDARFDVIERETGLMLCGERALMQGARTLLGRPTSWLAVGGPRAAVATFLQQPCTSAGPRVAFPTRAGTELAWECTS